MDKITRNLLEQYKFDGKRLIPEVLIIDALIYTIFGIQYFILPITIGAVMYDFMFLLFIFCLLIFLHIIGAIYYKIMPVAILLNSLLLMVGTALFGYMTFYFSGPYSPNIFVLGIVLLVLNGSSFVINIRGHWKDSIGTAAIIVLLELVVMAYLIFVYGYFVDYMVAVIVLCILLLEGSIFVKTLMKYRFNPFRMLNFGFFVPSNISRKPLKTIVVLGILITPIGLLGYGSATAFNTSFTIRAADDFFTTSSYWGPPSLTLKTSNTTITISDLNKIIISNDTLAIDPVNYRNGTLAYLIGVYEEGNPINYANYSDGAESYPNGTVFLSEPLNPGHGTVNVTFRYVYNNKVLEYLNISKSTLVMNYHGDFIYYDNIFDRIQQNYLFQLLDYWEVKFFLDIYNLIEFPHVFNYLDSVPIGRTTLNWAHGKWEMFQGISYDFEPGSYAVAPGNPGGTNLTIGELIGEEYLWEDVQDSWYKSNEQNRTLYQEATAAYEELYTEASALGYRTYITLGGGEIQDTWDGDIDYTRCPIDPISRNPDVLYGMMCYQDNNKRDGRYRVYKDCINQIAALGDQGKTILLGWIALNTTYYTDDEEGLERYIADCKIAQAAGMIEIFHAPIYRMQGKWGDDAILALHEALNEDPKEDIMIPYPKFSIDTNTLFDVVENLNYIWIMLPILAFICVKIAFSNFLPIKERIHRNILR